MKPQGWVEVVIDELCETIIDCVNKTAPVVDFPTPYKMIRTTNVRDGWISLSSVKYVDHATYLLWTRRQTPKKGDVILTREAPLGEVGMLRSDDKVFLGQRLVSYRANPQKLDNRFLLYAFQGDFLRAQIKALGSGSTVEHMRVPDAKNLKIFLPPLASQKKIGSILAAYDDLIENNTRRIEILEEMARRLYEKWFVQFRFPGYQEKQLSFEQLNIFDIFSVKYGKGLSKKELIDGGEYPVYGAAKVIGYYHSYTYADRQIIAGCRGSVGEFRITEPNSFVTNNSFVFLPRTSMDFFWGYQALKMRGLKDVVGGAAQPQITLDALHSISILYPSHELREAYSGYVSPLFSMIWNLERKNKNLRTQRDLLLPKLISGEIDVFDIPMPT